MPSQSELRKLIDLSYREHGLGGLDVNAYTIMKGLNAVGGLPTVPPNKDNQGYVFMTKPQMNLSYDNVIGQRKMAFMADPNPMSMGSAIRCMLNPIGFDPAGDKNRSKLIDDLNPFMPITNLLLTLSKPPDFTSDVFLSEEGQAKEQMGWTDGIGGYNGAYQLTFTFANMDGDPITAVFLAWYWYIHNVVLDTMRAFPINVARNRTDYQSRIYRLTTDASNTYVQRIYSSGPIWPISLPVGAPFGYDVSNTIITDNDQIQITFQCLIAEYYDPILVTEFNNIVKRFNPKMRLENRSSMVKVDGLTASRIPRKRLLNYRLYPYIAPSMELEWYAFKEDYNAIMSFADNINK